MVARISHLSSLMLLLLLPLMLSASAPSPDVTVTLPEGSPPGTQVVNLANRLKAQPGDIERFFMLNEQTDGQLLSLDSSSGVVKTRRQIDRDIIARAIGRPCESQCELSVMVHAQWRGRPAQLLTLRLELQAQNNHQPEFRVVNRQVEVSELAEVNRTSVSLPFLVLDRDSPRFGLRKFRLALPADAASDDDAVSVFDVEPRRLTAKDVAEPVRVSLLLRRPLDRETRAAYRLVLVATDAGEPPKTGTLTFTVTVRDENDNQPEWTSSELEFNISEAAPAGYLVTQLHAKDADAGQNGRIVYRFNEAQTDSLALQSFDLDAVTGQLRVGRAARLDFERQRVFRLPVIARDQGFPAKQAEALVTVRLLDENDETPSIRANGIASAAGGVSSSRNPPLTVSENRRAGELVGYVMATDRDSGENSRVTCRLAQASQLALNLEQSQDSLSVYRLVTKSELDRERDRQVTDTVICSDAGRPSRTASQQLRVTLLDENDSPPVFEQPAYGMELEEEQEPGSHIGRVTARDPDEAGQLKYSLDPEGDRLVSIDESSGLIRSRQRFDRESKDRYRFQVRVTDGAHWANASVELVIRDTNDHWPEWTGRHDLSVTENSPAGTFVGRLTATDADIGDNGRVGYAILPPSLHFEIRPDGGVFTRTSRLDRELTPVLEINVTAHDYGRPRRQSRWELLQVRLLDVNDNSPSFAFPSGVNNRINVSCREAANTVVATLSATDPDEAENGSVSYNMTQDGWQAGFGLDPRQGHLLLVRSLECRQSSLALKVTASDAGSPPRSSMRVLLVSVSDGPPDVGISRGGSRGGGGGGGGRTASGGRGGRRSGVNGAKGGRGGHPDLDSEATSLTAIVGLMIATGVLIVVLVFAVCLLRRRAGMAAAGTVAGSSLRASAVKRHCRGVGMSGKDISLPQQIGVDRSLLAKSAATQQQQQLQSAQAFALDTRRRRQSIESSPPPGYYNYPDGKRQPQQQQQLLFATQSRNLLQRNGSSNFLPQPVAGVASSYQTIRPSLRPAEMEAIGGNYSQLLMHGSGPAAPGSEDAEDHLAETSTAAGQTGATLRHDDSVGTPASARKSSTQSAGTVGKKLRTPYTTVSFV
ncbi:hypothetical protein BOX15_Mlig008928g3 [Macrostomum lignano]|uniref:Cadherin domain-containing protein n=1 Tax=Macrostomum lignano TaxID=282301 RepID=A0A267GUC0_9PLAT|nr:hypothetical protein BOX15_Mlig008928g3 [Macrostomum lignano]